MILAHVTLPHNVTDDQVKIILELFPKLTTVIKKKKNKKKNENPLFVFE